MAKKSVEPRLPSIREVLIGNRIVGVEERGDFLILTLEDGYQVHVLDYGKVTVHPNAN